MKITVLTSSRADYSIYFPLLKKLKDDPFFELSIIAFGTHASSSHGHTVDTIIDDGFEVNQLVESIVAGDSPDAINAGIARTTREFSTIWSSINTDLILSLGDRFEMFAAVLATLPFGLKVAHLHGGETTEGAIDNVYRHSISLMSQLHFVSTEHYKDRLAAILGSGAHIYNVGALSVENILSLPLLSIKEFKEKHNIDLGRPTILCTFHPETVGFENNKVYIAELLEVFELLKDFQVLITMPNIDTMGNYIRKEILAFAEVHPTIFTRESLGTIGYLSAMKHCAFLLGNTSSGFVEASVFPKKVINIGDRQLGRIVTGNIINSRISKEDIFAAVEKIRSEPSPERELIYGNGTTSDKIIQILKDEF